MIRLQLLTLLVFFTGPCAFAQKYKIDKISLVFTDSERNNRKVPVDIYYPLDSGYKNTESAITEKFPIICFGHGYLISGKWYSHINDMLVPEGFILIFPASEAGLFPSHRTLAKDMSFALNEVYKLSGDSSSKLYNRIDSCRCLMGHSMGGGSSFLAANLTADIKTIVTLAPFDTRPSAAKAASAIKIPTLIFAGSNDCITPKEKHQLPIFRSSASGEKTLIIIKGGTHCQMGVSHPKCGFGERISGCRGDNISAEEQLSILGRYIIPWLRFYLCNDSRALDHFNSTLMHDNSVEYIN
jgi:predicted dienelactone hydrolase